jgi:hypothetical protein
MYVGIQQDWKQIPLLFRKIFKFQFSLIPSHANMKLENLQEFEMTVSEIVIGTPGSVTDFIEFKHC